MVFAAQPYGDAIRVNSNYRERPDFFNIQENMNQAKRTVRSYEVSAERRSHTLAGRVLAQVDMIRAQGWVWQAEYESHCVSPRVHELHEITSHKNRQLENLQRLRGQLLGDGYLSMIRRYGFEGISAYAWSAFPNRFN